MKVGAGRSETSSIERASSRVLLDGATEVVRCEPRYLTPEETDGILTAIRGRSNDFRALTGAYGAGPRYRILHGATVARVLPEVVELGETRIRPLVESFAGCRLAPSLDPPEIRIQHYAGPHDKFRWHYDGHRYNALVTFVNTNGSETEVVPPRLSRLARRVYAPLALTPWVFSILPHHGFPTEAGDVVLLRGEGLLHRGGPGKRAGERLVIVYNFNEEGRVRKPMSALRRRIVSALNYGPGEARS